MDFRTSGALSSFAWSCRGNGGGRVRAPVGACKKINNLRPSYRHTGVAIGTSAKTHKKSTEHGACLLRGQCSRASIPRLSFGGHEKQLSRAYGAALRVAGGGAAPSGVRAEALRVAGGGGAAPSRVRAEEETALWEDPLMTAAQSLFFWLTAKMYPGTGGNSGALA